MPKTLPRAMTEVKVQAIALHALGHSCRSIEKQLRERFPGQHVPRYGTIARWVAGQPLHRPTIRIAWEHVYGNAIDYIGDHLEGELQGMPLNKQLRVLDRYTRILLKLQPIMEP